MIRIQQRHRYGCAVASIAMILDVDYDQALSLFPGDPDTYKGFAHFVVENILVEQGYAIARRYRYRPGFGNETRDPWPCLPWGKIHWCEVMTDQGAHAVVMLGDGTVLDPYSADRKTLLDPAYKSINFIAAVVKL